jgi:hypothetical protein
VPPTRRTRHRRPPAGRRTFALASAVATTAALVALPFLYNAQAAVTPAPAPSASHAGTSAPARGHVPDKRSVTAPHRDELRPGSRLQAF